MRPQLNTLSNKAVKVGVVGMGHIANSHLAVLTKLPEAEVVAICDRDGSRAERASEHFNIPSTYTNLAEMLEKEQLDVVDVVTPPDTHADLAIQAMQHGCHCLMEKPLTTNIRDADQVIRVAEETGRALHVTHNWSFFPSVRKAKFIADSGALGKVIGVDVRYLTSLNVERYFDPNHWCHRLPGGIFADISPHLAMILVDFLGEVNSVKAISEKLSHHPHIVADELKVIVEAGDGLGSFSLSFNSPVRQFTINIAGTKSSLSVNVYTNTIVFYKPIGGDKPIGSFREGLPRGLRTLAEISQQTAGLSSMALGVITGRHDYLDAHRYLVEASLRHIRGQDIYPIDIRKCREVVRVLEDVWDSIF